MGQLLGMRQRRKGAPKAVPKTLLIINDRIPFTSHSAPPPLQKKRKKNKKTG